MIALLTSMVQSPNEIVCCGLKIAKKLSIENDSSENIRGIPQGKRDDKGLCFTI